MPANEIFAELQRLMDESKATLGFSGIPNSRLMQMANDEPAARPVRNRRECPLHGLCA
jgi:hypothetical protein